MKLTRQILPAFMLSIIFLIVHIIILALAMDEMLNLTLILFTMALIQVLAYIRLRKSTEAGALKYKDIFFMLCLTQAFSIILLTLYSAFFTTFGKAQPLHPVELIFSLVIFAGIYPLIVSAIIWLGFAKKANQ